MITQPLAKDKTSLTNTYIDSTIGPKKQPSSVPPVFAEFTIVASTIRPAIFATAVTMSRKQQRGGELECYEAS